MTHQQPVGHKGRPRLPAERCARDVNQPLQRAAMARSWLYTQYEEPESDGVYVAIKTCEFKAQPLTVVEFGGVTEAAGVKTD